MSAECGDDGGGWYVSDADDDTDNNGGNLFQEKFEVVGSMLLNTHSRKTVSFFLPFRFFVAWSRKVCYFCQHFQSMWLNEW